MFGSLENFGCFNKNSVAVTQLENHLKYPMFVYVPLIFFVVVDLFRIFNVFCLFFYLR